MSFAAIIGFLTSLLKGIVAFIDWRKRQDEAAKNANKNAAQRQFETNEKRIDEEFKK